MMKNQKLVNWEQEQLKFQIQKKKLNSLKGLELGVVVEKELADDWYKLKPVRPVDWVERCPSKFELYNRLNQGHHTATKARRIMKLFTFISQLIVLPS